MNSNIIEIVEKLLKIDYISSITEEDFSLFKSFNTNVPEGSYADSWAYITQAVHMEKDGHMFGLKYHDNDKLLAIGIFNRPYENDGSPHILLVRPQGNWSIDELTNLILNLENISKSPVYLAKINPELSNNIVSEKIVNATSYPWNSKAPLEDDTHPEHIINLKVFRNFITSETNKKKELVKKFNQIHNKYNNRIKIIDYNPDIHFKVASEIVYEFFSPVYTSHRGISDPSDYANILKMGNNTDKGIHAKLIYLDDEPIAFFLAESTSSTKTVGIYTNIVLYKRTEGISGISGLPEILLTKFLLDLYKLNYEYANLGGSETRGLHAFKTKFSDEKKGYTHQMNWVVSQNKINSNNTQNILSSTYELSDKDFETKTSTIDGPQSQAMLILINVILGIALWQALIAFANNGSDTINFRNVSIFTILIMNLFRAFLGFVSFEINRGLSNNTIEKYTKRIDVIRLIDFILGVIAATLLIPLSVNCNNSSVFIYLLLTISLVFVIRNGILFVVYHIAKRESKTDISINHLKDNYIIVPFIANYRIIRFWFIIDSLILIAVFFFLLVSTNNQIEIYSILAFIIFIIMIIEIIYNSRYYFASGTIEIKDKS